jgi:putative colanic acid biosysnthesis UDP-glucose lipid carrier transferase
MKKLLDTAHNKITIPSFHVYKFLKEDTDSIDKDIYEGRNLSDIINYKSIATPLHIQPFDYRINRILKRITDIFFATFVIICILSWLIPIIAVLIKLDSKGPVFFLQKRNRKNGGIFTCIKFRSMIINEEADLIPATVNDTRITRIGKFLRHNYLDELPQFFNVLWGDMSVIGPRPHMISDNIRYEELVDHYAYRHKVKPGITGLAQVMGYVGLVADIQEMQDRVNLDIFYVRHWSLKLDFTILYRTIRTILG